MSSLPFSLTMKVVDEYKYAPAFDRDEVSFVLRGKSKEDVMSKLEKIILDVPEDMEMLIFHIGYRPDKPVPVAMYFAEVEIISRKTYALPVFWHTGWRGKKRKEVDNG